MTFPTCEKQSYAPAARALGGLDQIAEYLSQRGEARIPSEPRDRANVALLSLLGRVFAERSDFGFDHIRFEPYGLNSDTRKALEARGHKFADKPAYMGDAEGIMIEAQTGMRLGASDPRLGGAAVGY